MFQALSRLDWHLADPTKFCRFSRHSLYGLHRLNFLDYMTDFMGILKFLMILSI